MSSRTNAVEPAAMAGQLSSVPRRGVLVAFGCSHWPAEAASGWHQTAHSSEALGPTASVSTIDRTTARNTLLLISRKGKSRARCDRGKGLEIARFPGGVALLLGPVCGISPMGAEKLALQCEINTNVAAHKRFSGWHRSC